MSQVELRQLQLEGFGLYSRRTTFSLTSGINVTVSPNESGKSTFVAGLESILFGLPEKNDPEAWGTSRFRNWTAPNRFQGEAILLADNMWHRIRRDFATHKVHWAVARAAHAGRHVQLLSNDRTVPQDQIPLPSAGDWKVRFDEEHNPSGRGDALGRYLERLKDLLGVYDPITFRLAHCLTQDPDDRNSEETAYRSRHIPEGVQGLISGTGGQVDDVLKQLFDEFASVTQATGDAGLIRPGKTRRANQRTLGRLESVRERQKEIRGQLAAAEMVLEDLRGSQERLDELRRGLEQLRKAAEDDRSLKLAWDEWARARKDRQNLHKRTAEIERALVDLTRQEDALRKDEEKLTTGYPEYRSSTFSFGKQRQKLEALAAAEKERISNRAALEDARRRQRALQEQIADADEKIQSSYLAFEERPHLLRDFGEWKRVAAEWEQLSSDLKALDSDATEREEIVRRFGHWEALDPDAERRNVLARPAAVLKDLRDSVPRLLVRADEARSLDQELAGLEEQLSSPLKVVAEASEDVRREAEAFKDRQALHRIDAEKSVRQLVDVQERLTELERKQLALLNLEETLTTHLGYPRTTPAEPPGQPGATQAKPPGQPGAQEAAPPGQPGAEEAEPLHPAAQKDAAALPHKGDTDRESPDSSRLPEGWRTKGKEIRRRLENLREEGQLLRKIDENERTIRTGLFRHVTVPAMAAFLLAGGAGFVAGMQFLDEMPLRVGAGLGLGLAAATVAAILGHRLSKGAVVRDLRRARGRLVAVRRTLIEGDRVLRDLSQLDAQALTDLTAQLSSFSRLSGEVASLRVLAPSEEERNRARRDADQAKADLSAFEARMAVFGEHPTALVSAWRKADQRAAEIRLRLADLSADVGPADWARQPLESLPTTWQEAACLAAIIAPLLPTDSAENALKVIDAPATGGEIAKVLGRITTEFWEAWTEEIESFEAASQDLSKIRVRRRARDTGGESGESRLERLSARKAELTQACAPFALETPQDEIEEAGRVYESTRIERDKGRALMEELQSEIPEMEQKTRETEEQVNGHRDVLRGLLRPAGGDPVVALERLRDAGDLRAKLDQATQTHTQVLQSLNASDVAELRVRLEGVREEAGQAAAKVRELEDEFIFLREIEDSGPGVLHHQRADLERRIKESVTRLQELEETHEATRSRAADAEAEGRRLGNAAVLELEIRSLEQEEQRLLVERDALRIAFDTLREAAGLFHRTHRERLEDRATEFVRHLSLKPDRSLHLGERFEIQVCEAGGQACAIRQLSQGARDQLALGMRLAVADMLSDGICPPLIFDDPFLSFDHERTESMRQALERLSEHRQIIILTHRQELAAWGRAVAIEG
ncbi:MAG: AAA family ATPase [Candidatus Eisenbacteria sp.]|nr:AAA family ATPase [Candidatus Eisenbacteria bacterium]